MTESFVPSLREYAARYQINGRRLGARQILMHPGPVNRGVELAAEVIDSPQAVIGQQVAAGVVVRMAVLYELLAGTDRARSSAGDGMNAARPDAPHVAEPLVHREQPPADLLIRAAHVLDPRAGIDAPHDVLVRGGVIAELGAPGSLAGARGRRVDRRRGPPPVRRLRRPARAPARARPGAQGGPRLRHPRRGGGRLRRGRRDAEHRPGRSTTPPCCARCARRARREARIPVGFLASVTRRLEGEALTEMAELADAGALGFTDDGRPVHRAAILRKALQYQRLCGGVLALHEEDPSLSGVGVMHEGEVSARLGLAGIPSISESTMIARDAAIAGYEQGRIHIQHLSARESVEAVAEAKARGVQITRRGVAAPPHAHARGDPGAARHAAEDEPAAALRGRPPGADRRAARRHDRLHRDRPRAACARGEGGPVRAGADGHDGAGDRVRRAAHRAGRAGRAAAGAGRREAQRRRRADGPRDAADRRR